MAWSRPGSGFKQLLVSYRPRLHCACYVTRVDKDNVPGLDTVVETFQRRQVRTWLGQGGRGGLSALCSPPLMRNDEEDDEECPLSPLSRLRTGSPCPWLTAPSWAPRRASSAASSPSTGLSLAG